MFFGFLSGEDEAGDDGGGEDEEGDDAELPHEVGCFADDVVVAAVSVVGDPVVSGDDEGGDCADEGVDAGEYSGESA